MAGTVFTFILQPILFVTKTLFLFFPVSFLLLPNQTDRGQTYAEDSGGNNINNIQRIMIRQGIAQINNGAKLPASRKKIHKKHLYSFY